MGFKDLLLTLFGVPILVCTGVLVVAVLKSNYQSTVASSVSLSAARFGIAPENIPILIILKGAFIWFLCSFVGNIVIALSRDGGLDNANPRAETRRKGQGLGARLFAAHKNTLEQLAMFGIAVVCAFHCKVPLDDVIFFSTLWYFAQMAYAFCYAFDFSVLRSVVFTVAELSWISLLLTSVFGPKKSALFFENIVSYLSLFQAQTAVGHTEL